MPQSELHFAEKVLPGQFDAPDYWYQKTQNATIHPMISFFLSLSKERIINRYCHLHPVVDPVKLDEFLSYKPLHFHWAGADLINVTTAGGKKQMVVIENNSCPSGQKSMPIVNDNDEKGGYRMLIEECFDPYISVKRGSIDGALGVIYDKNPMEVQGYAHMMADHFGEVIYCAPFYSGDKNPPVRFREGVMELRTEGGEWIRIRAAFRYLTQKPWNRLPVHTRTRVLNPVAACLAGGRNKMIAAKAYDFFNSDMRASGLRINVPETFWDVSKGEIPLYVKKLGGQAVVKVPYSNAGQGVYTIVSKEELEDFMDLDFDYDQFIVQSLIGNYNWSSQGSSGKLYHVGTIPDLKGRNYVFDLRMMICATPQGYRPVCVYSRRASKPLLDKLEEGQSSWSMLGTNLSIKNPDGSWDTDTNRLIMMDRRDFNKLGLGLDDLIEAYIQTVLSSISIDGMANMLFTKKKRFRQKLFKSLNDDPSLINEIRFE